MNSVPNPCASEQPAETTIVVPERLIGAILDLNESRRLENLRLRNTLHIYKLATEQLVRERDAK